MIAYFHKNNLKKNGHPNAISAGGVMLQNMRLMIIHVVWHCTYTYQHYKYHLKIYSR